MKILIPILLLCASTCWAAPSVTDVQQSGSTLTVTGSSFGVKTTAAPTKYDSFEWGTLGETITNGDDPNTPYWQYEGGTDSSATLNSSYSHSGDRSAYSDGTLNDNQCYFHDSFIDVTPGLEMYVSYWMRWDYSLQQDMISTGDFFKGNRINSGGNSYNGTPYLTVNINGVDYDTPTNNRVEHFQYTTDAYGGLNKGRHSSEHFPQEEWYRVELYLKLSDPAGATNGELWWSLNGSDNWVYLDGTDPGGITRQTGAVNEIDVFTLVFGGCEMDLSSGNAAYSWQDDIYVDNTRARVEIGNASTWAASTHREIQIPTAWATGEITVDLKTGSFAEDATVYVYVVDSDGVVNASGELITLGGGDLNRVPQKINLGVM